MKPSGASRVMRRVQIAGLLLFLISNLAYKAVDSSLLLASTYLGAIITVGFSLRFESIVSATRGFTLGLTEIGLLAMLFDVLKLEVLPLGLEQAYWLVLAALIINILSMVLEKD
jgi:hypothetical protein